jgi:hypothetical protein
MATLQPNAEFSDEVAPADVTLGLTSGKRFLTRRKGTLDTMWAKYLLAIPGGFVEVHIYRRDRVPFREADVEPLLGTLRVVEDGRNPYRPPSEYDLTKDPARLRIFASHHQFWLADRATENPFDPLPEYNQTECLQGWARTPSAICILTKAPFNTHRLDVRLADHCDPDPKAERQSVFNLRLSSGTLCLNILNEETPFHLPPGDYQLYCRAYNLGAEDPDTAQDLTDEEFLHRDEWERYELVLVPGVTDHERNLMPPK